ncbi:MAG TPA: DUF6491 family protein [Allosphingosinicella sp.]|nr:DUF6491 family protein [Allosphingosinicella sp.]
MSAILIAAALAAAAGPPPPPAEQARIPFVGFRSIRTFHPVGDDIVYLQDMRRNWYRATLAGPCFNLNTALRIAVDTRYSGDTLDNTSSFLVDGQRCPIHSLVRSEPPPGRRHRR